MKSTMKIKAPISKAVNYDFGFGKHVITVSKLPITKEEHDKKAEEIAQMQNIPIQNARSTIQSKIIEVEAFNQIMDYLSSLFEFKIDADELKRQIEIVKVSPAIKQINSDNKDKIIHELAKKTIMKKLIFGYFIRNYNQLEVSLSESETIMKFNGLLENLTDKQKIAAVKNFQNNAIENKVIDWLIRQYKIVISLKSNK